jgi:Escherichia/Staphylococcus phage prohead protease
VSELPGTIRERGESDGRTVEIRIMPWGQVAETPEGRETFERGAFASANPGRVTVESQRHGGTLVGRGTDLVEQDDAAYLHARISETPAGDELLTLIRDGVVSEASVAFKPVKTARRKGVLVRQAVDLWRVAILERGSYPGAGVVAVRSQSEDENVTDENETTEVPPPDMGPVLERMQQMDDRIVQLQARAAVPPAPLEYRAESLAELYAIGFEEGKDGGKRLLQRALVDQIASANAGVVPPGVSGRAAVIINFGRPAITAQGTGSLPASGMTVQWPVLSTPLAGLVAKQATQKAAVASGLVSFATASVGIGTFAGAADVSYQLIRRSDPPYLEAWSRAMLAAWAGVTDAQFVTDVITAATQSVILTPASNGAAIVAALVDASLKVESATGSPATSVVVASDLYAAIAKAWASTSINPTATGGTASASTLNVNVSGLTITHDRNISAGGGWISNSLAAEWLEDGPFQVTAEDVERLGRNEAYWSLGASATYIPAGIVKIVPV